MKKPLRSEPRREPRPQGSPARARSRSRWLAPALGALALAGCETGGEDLFTHFLERWGVAGGVLGSYLGGLFVSLTPCVYPMIALTVSVFGASRTTTRGRAMALSACYVLGLAAMYTPLGVVAGLGGGLFGAALASPWVMWPVVALLVALSLSLLGYWELALPPSLQTRLSGVGGAGPVGAFLMGLVAGLLAAPCAGPVTLALVTWVGTTSDPVLGGLYFFSFALGIGTLFFLVGAFALSLPRAGRWTEVLKAAGGLAVLLVAGYYLRILVPGLVELPWREPWLLGLSSALGAAGIALGAAHLGFHGESPARKARKSLGVVAFALGGTGLVLAATEVEGEIAWREDYEAAEAEARAAARPMLIDFTAAWCGACGELDRRTFSDPRVAEAAAAFTAIRVDSTRQDERVESFMARHEVRGLPTVVLIDASGRESARLTEFVRAGPMLELLEAAARPPPAQ